MTFDPPFFCVCCFAAGHMYEGEFLDIVEIKRHQAEEFMCITNNGVASPDTHRVKVTVNCKFGDIQTRATSICMIRSLFHEKRWLVGWSAGNPI